MISIYTRTNNIFSEEYLKYLIKKIIGKKTGPEAVADSLIKGLDELKINFELNPRNPKYNVVHVLSGIRALQNAIRMKENGKIKTIIAGPNLVITPFDYNKIICNPNIDAILLPSEWTKKFYSDLTPEISNKLYVWPAGTNMSDINLDKKREGCIVYEKDVNNNLYLTVLDKLKSDKIKYTVIEYGKYNKKDYFDLLEKSECLIYLQKVESQGLAIQEAWARNVPTLVWNTGSFTYPQGYTVTGNISAPYLNEKSGMFFHDKDDFSNKFETFIKKLKDFTPHDYCLENLSNKISAEKYVSIVKSLIH